MSDIEKVKQLREATGAGFKDCNLAVKESGGDLDKAVEILRVKGISKASKKMSRDAKEGVIATSGNENKISIIEVNCETDFVARRSEFKELVRNIAMQIASDPKIEIISLDNISEELKASTQEFENNKEDLVGKPEKIKIQIVEGRVNKTLKTKVLLEQDYIRNSDITVNELIKQTINLLGENIKIARFERFILGN